MIMYVEHITSIVKLNLTLLKSSLCDQNDAYILLKGTIIVGNAGSAAFPDNVNVKGIFKNCVLFTDCMREGNSTLVVNSKDIDVVMPIKTLIE